jgi:uncharacterized paraquat-inducible protein A
MVDVFADTFTALTQFQPLMSVEPVPRLFSSRRMVLTMLAVESFDLRLI